MRKIGLDEKINIIKSLYKNSKARYMLGDIQTNWVNIEKEVRQGCTLSPLLFSLYMEELTRRIKN